MNQSQTSRPTGKAIALVVIVAVATAVVSTLLQKWLLGNSSPAITGGVVGAVITVVAFGTLKKK